MRPLSLEAAGKPAAYLCPSQPSRLWFLCLPLAAGAGEALYDREMKDYAETMTARQFVDIIAYLRNPKQPSRG
jgi:hypothetical protein